LMIYLHAPGASLADLTLADLPWSQGVEG
jgi:hypothetical protein